MEMTVVLQVDEKYRMVAMRKGSKYNVIISTLGANHSLKCRISQSRRGRLVIQTSIFYVTSEDKIVLFYDRRENK